MRVLIVDDEAIARTVLRQELDCLEGVQVVGEADNGDSALIEIAALRPDLVFLDIQMPSMSGFELLSRLDGGHLPVVIIVTAFNQHAIRAFEAGAVDYLLKPVSQERLHQAIQRAARLHNRPKMIAENLAHVQHIVPTATNPGKPGQYGPQKVVGRYGHEYFLLNPGEILAFQAVGATVTILTAKQRYLATHNLRKLEQRLNRGSFRRIHRNAIVNIDQVRKITMITSQRWLLTLNNGEEFVVSKRQARHVRDALHW